MYKLVLRNSTILTHTTKMTVVKKNTFVSLIGH